ncbi:MAG TPA: amino acid permease [Dongiaceae bacterium]|nr:amino acid permease [Dongiaceae bacterium]
MGLFQNFAISFSIICILAGGITAFPLSLSAAGGASLGIGWPIASIFALLVAAALGQVASAYPTAGGIYHWASILGNKTYGWVAAWLNLLGLMFVVSSVNFGVFLLFRDLFLVEVLHMDVTAWVSAGMFDQGWWTQTIFITIITIAQAIINHRGIRLTTLLTDFSGYLIFAVTIVLIIALIAFAPVAMDFGRLFTFADYTGAAGGGVWPTATNERWLGAIFPGAIAALILGLLQGVYTITGFDASGHTSEETRNAAREVPKGMIHSVFWSGLFGYIMVCAFVLAMPSVEEGAAQGWLSFPWTMNQSLMPVILKDILIIGIVLANFLCALAGLTSCSRMLFAFSRDGGVPWVSGALRKVSKDHRTPANAIWASAVLSIVATLYGDAFIVLSTGCAVFLYVSYAMPIGAGLLAEGKTWAKKGPFDLGGASKLVALLAVVGCVLLVIVGVQPPNEKVGYLLLLGVLVLLTIWYPKVPGVIFAIITTAFVYFLFEQSYLWLAIEAIILLAIGWFYDEKGRFAGPPLTEEAVKARQAEIAREEAALGGAG